MDGYYDESGYIYKPQHPLPEEIEKMTQDETVCQYCGVSYLIHNEVKKLQEKVETYRKEVDRLQCFNEREIEMKKSIQSLKNECQEWSDKWKLENEKVSTTCLGLEERSERIKALEGELSNYTIALKNEQETWKSRLQKIRNTSTNITENLYAVRISYKQICEDFQNFKATQIEYLKNNKNQFAREADKQQKVCRDLESKVKILEKDKAHLQANHNKAVQMLEDKYNQQNVQLATAHNAQLNQHETEKRKYQEQIRRLKESKEMLCIETERTVKELNKTIVNSKNSFVNETSAIEHEKQMLQDRVEKFQEELNELKLERAKLVIDHEKAVEMIKEEDACKSAQHSVVLEKKHQEFLDQQNEYEQQKNMLMNNHQREIIHIEENFKENLKKEKDVWKQEHKKMRSVMDSLQSKCEMSVQSLHQHIDHLKNQHSEELLSMKTDLLQARREIGEQNFNKANAKYSTEEHTRHVAQIRDLKTTVERVTHENRFQKEKIDELETEIRSLRECVRRECEERYELTEALSNVRTELLSLQRFSENKNNHVRRDIIPNPPSGERKSVTSSHSGSSEESWTRHATRTSNRKNKSYSENIIGRERPSMDKSTKNKIRISMRSDR